MKRLLLTCIIIFISCFSFAQTEAQNFKDKQLKDRYTSEAELKEQLIKHDFSALFSNTDNSSVYGFIGSNYQRIRIKFTSIFKNPSSSDTYNLYGKSMVKNNIDEFHGTIKISNIRKLIVRQHGCEDENKFKGYKGEFTILGDYYLDENEKQPHAGIFKGSLRSDFFLDKNNKVTYNDIEFCADGYTNNQFVGQWSAYKGNLTKRCNWGDFRVPNDGDLDIGAGEFSPNDKYLQYGWQSRRDLMSSNSNNEKAKKTEEAKWWK